MSHPLGSPASRGPTQRQGFHTPLLTGVLPTVRLWPQTKAPGITLTLGQAPRMDLISAEPHMPHVLMEKGDMTLGEFDQHLKRRTDFIKGMKKDSSAERKVRVTEAESGGRTRAASGT